MLLVMRWLSSKKHFKLNNKDMWGTPMKNRLKVVCISILLLLLIGGGMYSSSPKPLDHIISLNYTKMDLGIILLNPSDKSNDHFYTQKGNYSKKLLNMLNQYSYRRTFANDKLYVNQQAIIWIILHSADEANSIKVISDGSVMINDCSYIACDSYFIWSNANDSLYKRLNEYIKSSELVNSDNTYK